MSMPTVKFFDTAYRAGYTPWNDMPSTERIRALVERQEIAGGGRGLDLGSGRGANAAYLAAHGWSMTGVDFSGVAVRKARDYAAAAGVSVTFVQGDVTRLSESGIAGPFDLIIDTGCFHVLPQADRALYAAGVAQVAAPGAPFFIFACRASADPATPWGAEPEEIERLFGRDWEISAREDLTMARTGRLGTWFKLERRAG